MADTSPSPKFMSKMKNVMGSMATPKDSKSKVLKPNDEDKKKKFNKASSMLKNIGQAVAKK